jgi:uncharacterized membrane protein
MTRALLILAAVVVWLLCFGLAMVTIIPLAAMGFSSIFNGNFTIVERLQGVGFAILGVIVVAVLFIPLTAMTRFFTRRARAQD